MEDRMIGRRPAWGDTAVGVAVLALAAIVGWQTTLIPTNADLRQGRTQDDPLAGDGDAGRPRRCC